MVWFLVDDNLALHRKVIEAGNPAMGLWVRAGSWSAANLTNGYVPIHVLHQIGSNYQAKKLEESGLWSRVTGGYQFHDWHHVQPDAEQAKQRRDKARERQARHREKQRESTDVTRDVTRDSRARARPNAFKSVGNVTHHGDVAGAAAPTAAAPPPEKNWPPTKRPKPTDNEFYEQAEIQNCPLCDNEGRKPNGHICDHIDRAETHRNGMAQVRAALQKKPQPL